MIKTIILIIVLVQLFNLNKCEKARYDFYRVYQVAISTRHQLDVLNYMVQSSDSYKFIIYPNKVSDVVAIIVAPHKFAEFIDCLDDNNFHYKLLSTNLQYELDQEQKVPEPPPDAFEPEQYSDFGWNQYYSIDAINEWLKDRAEQFPKHLELLVGGRTYKGRDILGVKLSYHPMNPTILIDGGLHASEWISISVATFILNELLTSEDEQIREIAENYNWYIFPVINPDGYQYSREQNIFWRKTVKPYGACLGADVNRNFDIEWNVIEKSSYTCSDAYPGPEAFSEIETRTYSDFLSKNLNNTLKLYISLHAYSQKLMIPYAYTEKLPRNYDILMEISEAASLSLAKLFQTQFTVGSVVRQVYPATGSSMDWVFDKLNVPLAFTYELRPQFGHGDFYENFKLPLDQIVPTSKETLASILTILNKARDKNIF